jgi:hypothetical protein
MWPCPQLPWLVLTAIETAVSAVAAGHVSKLSYESAADGENGKPPQANYFCKFVKKIPMQVWGKQRLICHYDLPLRSSIYFTILQKYTPGYFFFQNYQLRSFEPVARWYSAG